VFALLIIEVFCGLELPVKDDEKGDALALSLAEIRRLWGAAKTEKWVIVV
jgi:hypothetical protein